MLPIAGKHNIGKSSVGNLAERAELLKQNVVAETSVKGVGTKR